MRFHKDFGLYHMLAKIADGDYLKIQELYKEPIKAIFNHLSYISAGGVKLKS